MDVETYVRENILITGEDIVWRGRPVQGRPTKRALPRLLFGLVFVAFAVFWTAGAYTEGGLFGLLGLPFIAIGVWFATSPMREKKRAANTYYAVTTERALIIEMGSNVRTTSIAPDDITDLQRSERPDGSGDLQLRSSAVRRHRHRRGGDGQRSRVAGFTDGFWGAEDIAGAVAAIDKLVLSTQEPAKLH